MARNIRDGLPWSPNLDLWDPFIPDFKSPPLVPSWIPPELQPLPQLPDFKVWDWLIHGEQDSTPSRPGWISPPLPSPLPGPSPFPDPAPSPSPQQRPPAHEVDPPRRGSLVTESHPETGGGLPGLLREAMRRSELQSGAGFEANLQDTLPPAISAQSKLPVRRLVRMSLPPVARK